MQQDAGKTALEGSDVFVHSSRAHHEPLQNGQTKQGSLRFRAVRGLQVPQTGLRAITAPYARACKR